MTFRRCSCESEVIQALKNGHWPEACGKELRGHVASCSNCQDLVLVTETFQQARKVSMQVEHLISPGLLWWRAELRKRNYAAKRISQPITMAQAFAGVMSLLVAVLFLASPYRYGLHWGMWWSELVTARSFRFWPMVAIGPQWNLVLLIPGAGILILLSRIVLYLVREEE